MLTIRVWGCNEACKILKVAQIYQFSETFFFFDFFFEEELQDLSGFMGFV